MPNKHALKRYHHAREHYSCRVDHTVDCFDIAGTVVDALASSYEFIARGDLIDRIMNELDALRASDECEDSEDTTTPHNPLFAFLSTDEDTLRDKGVVVRRVDGCVTWEDDLKAAFNTVMDIGVNYKRDPAVFQQFGYAISAKLENVCRSCKQLAKGGREKCCPGYCVANRTKKHVVYGMALAYGAEGDGDGGV